LNTCITVTNYLCRYNGHKQKKNILLLYLILKVLVNILVKAYGARLYRYTYKRKIYNIISKLYKKTLFVVHTHTDIQRITNSFERSII